MMFDGSTSIYTGIKKSPQKCRLCGIEEPEVLLILLNVFIVKPIGI